MVNLTWKVPQKEIEESGMNPYFFMLIKTTMIICAVEKKFGSKINCDYVNMGYSYSQKEGLEASIIKINPDSRVVKSPITFTMPRHESFFNGKPHFEVGGINGEWNISLRKLTHIIPKEYDGGEGAWEKKEYDAMIKTIDVSFTESRIASASG